MLYVIFYIVYVYTCMPTGTDTDRVTDQEQDKIINTELILCLCFSLIITS